MVMWWAVFFVCGALLPPEPRIHSLVLVLALLQMLPALARGPFGRHRMRAVIVILVSTVCMIHAGLARQALDLARRDASSTGARRTYTAPVNKVQETFTAMRGRILGSLESSPLSDESRKLLGALLFAERAGVERTVRDAYNYLGIGHILALSGLHLGIVTIPIGLLLLATGLPRAWRDSLLLAILALYMALAAFPPSLIRAFALVAAIVLYRSGGCKIGLLDALVTGALFIALIDFETVARPGFQLSFCAVCAIATIGLPAANSIRTILPGGIAGAVARFICYPVIITISIQCATLPLVLHLFGRSSLIAPLSNLLVMIPVTAFLYTGIAFLAFPVGPARVILAAPVNLLSRLLWYAPGRMAHDPHPAVLAGDIDPALHTAGIVFLAIALRCSHGRRLALSIVSGIFIASSIALAHRDSIREERGPVGGFEPLPVCTGRDGTPACVMIRSGVTLLVVERGISRMEAIRTTRALWRSGIRKIDRLILAQCSTERLDGFHHLIGRVDVGEVLASPYLLSRVQGRARSAGRSDLSISGIHSSGRNACGGFLIEVSGPAYPPAGRALPASETGLSLRISRKVPGGDPVTVLRWAAPERIKSR